MKVEMAGISADGLTGYSPHTHDQWEIVVCLKGQGLMRVGTCDISVRPGLIVCQPPEISQTGSELKDYQDMWFRLSDYTPPSGNGIGIFQDDEEKRFTKLGWMLCESMLRQEPNSARIVQGLWNTMDALLTGWSSRRINDHLVENLVRQIVLNMSNCEFDLAACMRESGYCLDHCRRRFSREMGETPAAYMLALRMEHACKMLALNGQGGHTVREIARMCGFSDPYYFSTMFRKKVGCSPSEYMRRNS